MKKIIYCMMIICLSIGLAGCGDDGDNEKLWTSKLKETPNDLNIKTSSEVSYKENDNGAISATFNDDLGNEIKAYITYDNNVYSVFSISKDGKDYYNLDSNTPKYTYPDDGLKDVKDEKLSDNNIKSQAEKALKRYDLKYLDILHKSEDGKLILSVQINSSDSDVIKCTDIANEVSNILRKFSEYYDIEIVSNNQMIIYENQDYFK